MSDFSFSEFQLFRFSLDNCFSFSATRNCRMLPGLEPPPALESVSSVNLVVTDRAPGRTSIALLALAFGALWFVCCRHLSTEWSFNEQYNYGWFVPFFAAYLFWLRWEDRPGPDGKLRHQKSDVRGRLVPVLLIVSASLVLLPLRVFEIGSADWRPLGWLHAIAVATITLSILYLAGGPNWLRHFSFPVLFFLVAVPWPTPIEGPIVQNLMRVIAASAAEVLALFGIPAEVQGNLIRLPSGMVGVNEACSGVRSLQTSLTIGLLFGELKRLRAGSRLLLIGAALAIAMVANFLRATFLVWLASARDTATAGHWHDIAGYAIVVLVFAGTMWIAAKLGSKKAKVEDHAAIPQSGIRNPPFFLPSTFSLLLLLWIVAVEVGAESWYRIHEGNLVTRVPWSVRWPKDTPGYHEIKINNEVRNMLRFDSGREVSWSPAENSPAAFPRGVSYLFFFRWNPGSGTILRARAHRPDVCLPAAGWRQVGDDQVVNCRLDASHSLPFRTFHFVKENGDAKPVRATALFTLHEDVAHVTEGDSGAGFYSNWDWRDRWRIVRNGIRNRGQQVLELIMVIPPQISDSAAEEECRRLMLEIVVPTDASG